MVVYLDDILIFTRTEEEHAKAIQWVLQVLQDNKLFLHPEKCEFYKERIEYLGLVILENEVSMDPVKVTGVREWSTLENKTDVVMSYKCLGKISDNLHPNNQNNRLKRKAQPLRDVPLDTPLWT